MMQQDLNAGTSGRQVLLSQLTALSFLGILSVRDLQSRVWRVSAEMRVSRLRLALQCC